MITFAAAPLVLTPLVRNQGLAVAEDGEEKGLDTKKEGGCSRFVEGLVFSKDQIGG